MTLVTKEVTIFLIAAYPRAFYLKDYFQCIEFALTASRPAGPVLLLAVPQGLPATVRQVPAHTSVLTGFLYTPALVLTAHACAQVRWLST